MYGERRDIRLAPAPRLATVTPTFPPAIMHELLGPVDSTGLNNSCMIAGRCCVYWSCRCMTIRRPRAGRRTTVNPARSNIGTVPVYASAAGTRWSTSTG